MKPSILIVEDEETLRSSLQRVLRREGYRVDVAASAEEGLRLCLGQDYDLVLSDINLPGMDGISMLARLKEQGNPPLFLVLTAYGTLETAIGALRVGAFDYLLKPIKHDALRHQVAMALASVAADREEASQSIDDFVGADGGLKHLASELRTVVETPDSGVLLLGETGTGKGFLARTIHGASARGEAPFMAINCGAVPEHLIESELFGHVRGAFTGAVRDKTGLFEAANGGTVFLDEIGDMPLAMQVKLLQVLEDGALRPVGDVVPRAVDVRIISATNKDLNQAIAAGRFRQDLYYRINLFTLELPPLRKRRQDVPALVNHWLARYESRTGRTKRFSEEAMACLQSYHWPGNIRELQNVVERCALISRETEIHIDHMPMSMHAAPRNQEESALSIEAYTKKTILDHQGHLSETELAKLLGITRKTLWEKRKKWQLYRPG